VLAVLAAGLLLRDFATRRYTRSDRRLGLDAPAEEAPTLLSEEPPARGRIDQMFQDLIYQSGTDLSDGAALALVIGGAIVGGAIPFVLTENLLFTAAGVFLGVLIPLGIFVFLRWRRLRALRKALPETLQVVAEAIRTGRTLEQTSEMVAEEMSGPLADEFAYAAKQLSLGHTPVRVLARMVRRVPLAEFRIFATAIAVHRQAGGNLSLLTERLANSARDREQFLGHLAAVTAGSRLSAIGLIVLAVVGVAVLTVIEPNYLRVFFTSPYGPPLLLIAGTLYLIGILWVWRVMRVEY